MERIGGILLARGVELLLGVMLFKTYGMASGMTELWLMFVRQPELQQVGTIASLAIVGTSVAKCWKGAARGIRSFVARCQQLANKRDVSEPESR